MPHLLMVLANESPNTHPFRRRNLQKRMRLLPPPPPTPAALPPPHRRPHRRTPPPWRTPATPPPPPLTPSTRIPQRRNLFSADDPTDTLPLDAPQSHPLQSPRPSPWGAWSAGHNNGPESDLPPLAFLPVRKNFFDIVFLDSVRVRGRTHS
jgi:hypothetical protein